MKPSRKPEPSTRLVDVVQRTNFMRNRLQKQESQPRISHSKAFSLSSIKHLAEMQPTIVKPAPKPSVRTVRRHPTHTSENRKELSARHSKKFSLETMKSPLASRTSVLTRTGISTRTMSSRDSSLGSPNTSKKLLSSAQSFGSIVEEVDASVPLSSAHALKKYMSVLNSHEQLEMLEFQCIYFVGLGATKVQPNFAEPNDGYDDDNGFYRLTSGDHIAYRYEVKGLLGKGSFGQVVKAYDHKRGETVALKILRNKKRFQKQGTVEIKVLDRLRSKDPGDRNNIVKMKSCFVFRRHICIAFEQLSINLYDFVKANEFQGLSLTLIRRFTVQLLIALSVTKALNIVHCDLKPENILLCQPNKSAIKVIDFGSACFSHERVYTYIQSRFYRAPEVVLQLPYDPAIDMWSLGCILAELFTGQPLFPAENEHQLLLRLIEILDTPPLELLLHSKRRSLFFNGDGTPKLVPDRSGRIRYPRCLSLAATLSCSDGNFISFLQRCLTWDPKARLTPEEGLSHPWIRAEEGISV